MLVRLLHEDSIRAVVCADTHFFHCVRKAKSVYPSPVSVLVDWYSSSFLSPKWGIPISDKRRFGIT